MEMNAYEKMKKVLMDTCCDFKYEVYDLFDEENEKAKKWLLDSGYEQRIKNFVIENPDSKFVGLDYSFENGLDFYLIEASYTNEKGNSCMRREMVLTEKSNQLVCVSFESEKQTYFHVLQDSEGNTQFPSEEKLVEFTDTTVYLKGNYHGTTFHAYNNLTDSTLLQETFQPETLVLNRDEYEDSSIVPLLYFHSAELVISYRNMQPIHVQTSYPYQIENIGYDPNSSKDAFRAIKMVNQEVDAIIQMITSMVENYDKENSGFQKTIGRNPQEK